MNAINFDKEMEKVIAKLKSQLKRPKLLLHSCCAPCSTACIERLKETFDITVYYYNPNMDTLEEYLARLNEQKRFCNELNVKVIDEGYLKEQFDAVINGLENEKEGGKRCEKCFYLRLKKTADRAKDDGYEYFATTLTVSPLKNAQKINEIGQEIANESSVKYLPTDFKKKGGYLRSVELSKEYNLYRQNYCGCEYSKR